MSKRFSGNSIPEMINIHEICRITSQLLPLQMDVMFWTSVREIGFILYAGLTTLSGLVVGISYGFVY